MIRAAITTTSASTNNTAAPAATPPTVCQTVGKVNNNDNDNHKGIMNSIASLRSLLMLDTPARRLLLGGTNKLSPPTTLPQPPSQQEATTTESQHDKSTSSSSSLSLLWLQRRLDDEVARRKSLEETYQNLVKFGKQQSMQLDLLTQSKADLQQQLSKTQDEWKADKTQQLQSLQKCNSQLESLQEQHETLKQALEQERSRRNSNNIDDNTSMERNHQSLERHPQQQLLQQQEELETLPLGRPILTTKTNHEHNQEKMKFQKSRIETLEKKIMQLEHQVRTSENEKILSRQQLSQTKADFENAQAELMAQVVVEKDELQQRWTREKQSMMTHYNESVEACVEAQRELDEITEQLLTLRQKTQVDHQTSRKESQEQLQIMLAELEKVKQQLRQSNNWRAEKADLEQKLRIATERQHEFSQHTVNSQNKVKNLDQPVDFSVSAAATTTATRNEDKFRNEAKDLSQNLIRSLTKATHEIEALRAELEDSQKLVIQKEEKTQNLQRKLHEARSDGHRLSEELDFLNQALQEKDEALEEHRNVIQELQDSLQKNQTMSSEDDRHHLGVETRTQTTPGLCESAQQEQQAQNLLRAQVQKLQEERTILSNEMEAMKRNQERHMFDLATQREKCRGLQGDLEDAENRISELEAALPNAISGSSGRNTTGNDLSAGNSGNDSSAAENRKRSRY